MEFLQEIRKKASQRQKTIVFPEGTEERTIKAAGIILADKIVSPILLGDANKIKEISDKLKVSLSGAKIINPENAADLEKYAGEYYELRKHKGMTPEEALKVVANPLFYGAFLVRNGIAQGAVSGAVHTTGDVMRAAIQVVGLAQGMKVVSSSFMMLLKTGQIITFADCAVVPDPDAEQLASIAAAAANTHEKLTGEKARVALLSFSTKGSASHPLVEKVVSALEIAKANFPNLNIDGELQFDAAFLPEIAERKAPGSKVAGKANVFVFPDLNAGNIGYKMVQRLAGAEAVGPVVQGLAKPYNDLSRGCSVDDIVNVSAICALNS
jgi:phosphate acetyltransferase